ncbi:MAG: STT3 domain-containing protein, partial [Candidatus Bathyarchaeota archaeon]|nr:STT3 domain-containing protein [Candidatus Bathyarchaeota archaeon]
MSRGVGAIFIVLVLASFIPHTMNASTVAGYPGPLASSGVPAVFDGKYSHDWIDALNWLEANTTEDSIICSWWDYGYWIESVANRTTLADGSTRNATQIVNIARMMLEPKNESLRLMKQYNVDYVVVFVTFNPTKPTEEWPYGDNVKWPAMASIAGYNMTKFITQDPQTGQTQYTKAFLNSTIAGLMYGIKGIETNFKPVYHSGFGWVLVYKVEY